MSARCGPNWLPSPMPRPTTGRFSKSSGPTNGRSTFFMRISARFPTVATDWYEKYRAVLRDGVDGVDKVALSPRQGDDGTGGSQARTRVFPQARAPHALRSLKANGCALRRRPPTRSWSTSA